MNTELKDRRTALRLSQDEVAKFLRVSRYTVMRWEAKPDRIPLGQYQKLVREYERLEKLKYGLDGTK